MVKHLPCGFFFYLRVYQLSSLPAYKYIMDFSFAHSLLNFIISKQRIHVK